MVFMPKALYLNLYGQRIQKSDLFIVFAMILVHIIAKNKGQSLKIIDLLIEKKLLFKAAVSEKTVYHKKRADKKLFGTKQFLIIGTTKALLYNEINKELQKTFPKHMPEFYSIPVVYMNEKQADRLKETTAEVHI